VKKRFEKLAGRSYNKHSIAKKRQNLKSGFAGRLSPDDANHALLLDTEVPIQDFNLSTMLLDKDAGSNFHRGTNPGTVHLQKVKMIIDENYDSEGKNWF